MSDRRAQGLFEAFVNRRARRPDAADRALMETVTATVQGVVGRSQVRWAGSQHKGTAIEGSDLDLCVETSTPVTEAKRRELRAALAGALDRAATVHRHVVRLPESGGRPKVDISFTNAAFGSRPLPDAAPFRDRPARQRAARALKVWARGNPLPALPGWVVEGLVLHLDVGDRQRSSLELFCRVTDWLASKATPPAVEGVLRPLAHPRWDERWSSRLPGQLEAVANASRALSRRAPQSSEWSSVDDVARWLVP